MFSSSRCEIEFTPKAFFKSHQNIFCSVLTNEHFGVLIWSGMGLWGGSFIGLRVDWCISSLLHVDFFQRPGGLLVVPGDGVQPGVGQGPQGGEGGVVVAALQRGACAVTHLKIFQNIEFGLWSHIRLSIMMLERFKCHQADPLTYEALILWECSLFPI